MLSADQTTSFAGTWGKERKSALGHGKSSSNDYTTTARSSFDSEKFKTHIDENNNKFAKFVSILSL